MAIRSIAMPLLSGGVLLLGYAAFSWSRKHRARAASNGPITLREAGLTEPGSETARPTSESTELPELDLDLDFDDEVLVEPPASAHGSSTHGSSGQHLGAQFIAHATDALSPFGHEHDYFEHEHFDLDQFELHEGTLDVASSRTRSGIQGLAPAEDSDEIPASERRPSVGGARS